MHVDISEKIGEQILVLNKEVRDLHEQRVKVLSDEDFLQQGKNIQKRLKYWKDGKDMLKVLVAHFRTSVGIRHVEKTFFNVSHANFVVPFILLNCHLLSYRTDI